MPWRYLKIYPVILRNRLRQHRNISELISWASSQGNTNRIWQEHRAKKLNRRLKGSWRKDGILSSFKKQKRHNAPKKNTMVIFISSKKEVTQQWKLFNLNAIHSWYQMGKVYRSRYNALQLLIELRCADRKATALSSLKRQWDLIWYIGNAIYKWSSKFPSVEIRLILVSKDSRFHVLSLTARETQQPRLPLGKP